MAIGSDAEIGAKFGGLDGFDFAEWRMAVGADLMGGYGRVVYCDNVLRDRYYNEILEEVNARTDGQMETALQPTLVLPSQGVDRP
jgi:hypothetical protein